MNDEQPSWVSQGSDEIAIKALPEDIFAILEDSPKLPQWMPAVKSTDGCREVIGSIRKCDVNFEGRNGYVVEECVVYDRPPGLAGT